MHDSTRMLEETLLCVAPKIVSASILWLLTWNSPFWFVIPAYNEVES